MDIFSILARIAITILISVAMNMLNRPKTPDAPDPEKVEDLPRADEGIGIQNVWGTGWVNMDIVWYGDRRTRAIKS